uniref:SPATA6 domain-containing protein n=1 Tax=Mesocestoides corti TaxID=53468 RepID=A0A5K3FHP8_MESCO
MIRLCRSPLEICEWLRLLRARLRFPGRSPVLIPLDSPGGSSVPSCCRVVLATLLLSGPLTLAAQGWSICAPWQPLGGRGGLVLLLVPSPSDRTACSSLPPPSRFSRPVKLLLLLVVKVLLHKVLHHECALEYALDFLSDSPVGRIAHKSRSCLEIRLQTSLPLCRRVGSREFIVHSHLLTPLTTCGGLCLGDHQLSGAGAPNQLRAKMEYNRLPFWHHLTDFGPPILHIPPPHELLQLVSTWKTQCSLGIKKSSVIVQPQQSCNDSGILAQTVFSASTSRASPHGAHLRNVTPTRRSRGQKSGLAHSTPQSEVCQPRSVTSRLTTSTVSKENVGVAASSAFHKLPPKVDLLQVQLCPGTTPKIASQPCRPSTEEIRSRCNSSEDAVPFDFRKLVDSCLRPAGGQASTKPPASKERRQRHFSKLRPQCPPANSRPGPTSGKHRGFCFVARTRAVIEVVVVVVVEALRQTKRSVYVAPHVDGEF